jgi:hypothetical protein
MVLVSMEFPGATTDQYDLVHAKLTASPIPGCLVHSCSKLPDGLRIVDVWESEEQFQKFAGGMRQAVQAEGFGEPQNMTVLPVHNMQTDLAG